MDWALAREKLRSGTSPGAGLRLADFSRRGIYYVVGREGEKVMIGLRRDGVFMAYADEDGEYDNGRGEVIFFEQRSRTN